MDIVGGVRLVDGSEAKIVSGIDDHSRFVISYVVARATAKPTCDALALAKRRHGVPEPILTDNGKVFTNRFGRGTGEVLFDRICRDNGIRHILTAPRSPTTTGKIERWHKTLRREFLDGKVFADIDDAQGQLDVWVEHYNHDRPHQSLGMAAPWERFRLAASGPDPVDDDVDERVEVTERPVGSVATRKVLASGLISFASTKYRAGRWLAGETVQVTIDGGLVQLHHRGVLIATHARHHKIDAEKAALMRATKSSPRPPVGRPSATSASVTRKVDTTGNVSFAGTSYRAGNKFRRRGDKVEISIGNELIRVHKVRHDRTREHGALANPGGRPNRINAA